jgi:NADH/NAD ratio-sensing transcriptional regulator Rex
MRQNIKRAFNACSSVGGRHFGTAIVNTIKSDTHGVHLINIYENEKKNLGKKKTDLRIQLSQV